MGEQSFSVVDRRTFPKTEKVENSSNSCPKCGAVIKKMRFRTGSLSHPSEEKIVCQVCGFIFTS
jgi:transposase